MRNKVLKMMTIATFMLFGACSVANADMKCADGNCSSKMKEKCKMDKKGQNEKCPASSKCNMKEKSSEKPAK